MQIFDQHVSKRNTKQKNTNKKEKIVKNKGVNKSLHSKDNWIKKSMKESKEKQATS